MIGCQEFSGDIRQSLCEETQPRVFSSFAPFQNFGFVGRHARPILKAIQSFRGAFAGYVCYEESSVNLGIGTIASS